MDLFLIYGLTVFFGTVILLIGHFTTQTEFDNLVFQFIVCLGIVSALILAQVVK